MYRSEQKFVVDENTLQVMHHKLSGMLDFYRIRSMYFDTYSRKSYRENDAGVKERSTEFEFMIILNRLFDLRLKIS